MKKRKRKIVIAAIGAVGVLLGLLILLAALRSSADRTSTPISRLTRDRVPVKCGETASEDADHSLIATAEPLPPPPTPSGMALIPAGSFTMGNSPDPNEGWSEERPIHSIYVSAFYMDKYEVTKAKWDEVANWAKINGYDLTPSWALATATNHPANCINWGACVKWCNARSQKEGLTPCYMVGEVVFRTGSSTPDCNWSANGYRLPTEAEWEKAARGGVIGLRFPWGNTIQHAVANYYSHWPDGRPCFPYDTSPTQGHHPTYIHVTSTHTSPVGSFAANGYGLHDMAGNVWEWCWDWWSPTYYSSSPGTDPRGPSSGLFRVKRGGAWSNLASSCRVAHRRYHTPLFGTDTLGFRTVCVAP